MAVLKDAKNKPIDFTWTDDSVVDAHQERVMSGGVILSRFRKNPIALFQHNSWRGLIGHWQNIRKVGTQIIANLNLSDNPLNELAQWVRSEILGGHLRGVSIGFVSLTSSSDEKHKLPGQQRETKLKTLLFEVSVVIIPSNPNSVVKKFAKFLFNREGETKDRQLTEEELKEFDLKDFDFANTPIEYKTFHNHITKTEKTTKMDIHKLAQLMGIDTEGKTIDELEGLIAQKLAASQTQVVPTPSTPTGGNDGESQKQNPSEVEVGLLISLGEQKGFVTADNKAAYQALAGASLEGFTNVKTLIDTHVVKSAQGEAPVSTPITVVDLLKNINTGKLDATQEQKGWDFVEWTKKDAGKIKDLVMKAAPGESDVDEACKTTFGMSAYELGLALKFGSTEPIKTVYSKHLAEKLYPDNAFYKGNALVDTEIVAGEVIMGEVVDEVEVIWDGEDSDDATDPKRRKDKKNTYKARTARTRPTIISFVTDAVFSYDERNSILYNHREALNTAIAGKILEHWLPTVADSMIRTSGVVRKATAPNASGNRKALAKTDFTSAISRYTKWDLKKKDDDGNDMIKAMFDDTFENDLWNIDDFIHVDKLGDETKKRGVFGRVLGVEIYLRSQVGVYSNAALPVLQAWNNVVSGTGNLAGFFWHTRCVRYAEGRSVSFPQAGRGEYGGDLFNIANTTGAEKAYSSQKGALAVIESHDS